MIRSRFLNGAENDMQSRIETLFQIAKAMEVDVRELLVSSN